MLRLLQADQIPAVAIEQGQRLRPEACSNPVRVDGDQFGGDQGVWRCFSSQVICDGS